MIKGAGFGPVIHYDAVQIECAFDDGAVAVVDLLINIWWIQRSKGPLQNGEHHIENPKGDSVGVVCIICSLSKPTSVIPSISRIVTHRVGAHFGHILCGKDDNQSDDGPETTNKQQRIGHDQRERERNYFGESGCL